MKRILIAAVLALAACSPAGQQTAIASVAASQASLTAAGRVILACYALPQCAAVAPKPQIKTAFDAAYIAVTSAQAVADKGGVPDMTAVASTLEGLQALVLSLPKTS